MFNNNLSIILRARTLLAGAVIAAAATSCSDSDDTSSLNHLWDINGNQIVDIKPERYKMLRNPLTGWVLYTGLGDGLNDSFWDDYDNMESSVVPIPRL